MMKTHLSEVSRVLLSVDDYNLTEIYVILWKCFKEGKTLVICGNGGSAATASHIVCDFQKGLGGKSKVICLSDNTNLLTAWSNDEDYEFAFAEILKAWVGPGDVLLVLSGSGNSANIVYAVEAANELGCTTVGLTGQYSNDSGGTVAGMVDKSLVVLSKSMQVIEDVHMAILHGLYLHLHENLEV